MFNAFRINRKQLQLHQAATVKYKEKSLYENRKPNSKIYEQIPGFVVFGFFFMRVFILSFCVCYFRCTNRIVSEFSRSPSIMSKHTYIIYVICSIMYILVDIFLRCSFVRSFSFYFYFLFIWFLLLLLRIFETAFQKDFDKLLTCLELLNRFEILFIVERFVFSLDLNVSACLTCFIIFDIKKKFAYNIAKNMYTYTTHS